MSTLGVISSAGAVALTAASKSSSQEDRAGAQLAQVSPGLAKANQRLRESAASASAQLSGLGKLKSALDALQSAAKTTSAGSPTETSDVTVTSTQRLIESYNAALTAASKTSTGEGPGAKALRTLQRSAMAGDGSLARLGIKRASDGTLTLNSDSFKAALTKDAAAARTSLAALSDSIGKAAGSAQTGASNVSDSMAALELRITTVKNQQSSIFAVAQQIVDSRSTRVTQQGLLAYLRQQQD